MPTTAMVSAMIPHVAHCQREYRLKRFFIAFLSKKIAQNRRKKTKIDAGTHRRPALRTNNALGGVKQKAYRC
jgi:hypothetical protein